MILVVKLSGKVLEDAAASREVCRQIAELVQRGHRTALVHGGGKQLTELAARLGIPTRQYEGRRVTDEAMLEAAKMVFSGINRDLVASLLRAGVTALGLAAYDAGLSLARKRPPVPVGLPDGKGGKQVETVDFGWVGDIESVDPSVLFGFWELGLTPVIACLCADASGQVLNVNADTLAAELAVALKADRLLALSDVEGIYLEPDRADTLLTDLGEEEARQLLGQGRLADGMIPKVQAALKMLERGVGSFQLASGLRPGALLEALEGKAGTLLRRSANRGHPL